MFRIFEDFQDPVSGDYKDGFNNVAGLGSEFYRYAPIVCLAQEKEDSSKISCCVVGYSP